MKRGRFRLTIPNPHGGQIDSALIKEQGDEYYGVRDLLISKREEILRIAAKNGASNVRVFGSVARGEAGEESDVDLLVELEPGSSLLDHVALLQDLEDMLSRKVDVVNEKALHPFIRDRVLREAAPL